MNHGRATPHARVGRRPPSLASSPPESALPRQDPEARWTANPCTIGTNLETFVQGHVLAADRLLQELCT